MWEASRRYGLAAGNILDFSASINPLGPPPRVMEELARALGDIRNYPDPEALELREELARFLGVSPEMVMVTNGGAEAIDLLARLGSGREVLLLAPSFGEYARAVLAGGGRVRYLPLNPAEGFRPDPLILARATGDVALAFLGNPNNPTGVVLGREELVALAYRPDNLLVVDEAFLWFAPGGMAGSVAREAGNYPGLVAVGSLTKIFAIPGLRLGYLVAEPGLVTRLERWRYPWSVNTLALRAGVACLQETGYLEESRALVERERPFLMEGLAAIPGLACTPSRANFVLVDCRLTGYRASELQERLGYRGLLIRDAGSFPGLDGYYFRVAVRRRQENLLLLAALREVLGDGKGGRA